MSQDMHDKGGKGKAPMPWFKKYPVAYLDGTRMLTPEERGIYEDCLCLIYKHDRDLPKNDTWIANELHVHVKIWRRVRDVLIKHGKLIETPDGYTNNRAAAECEERRNRRSNKVATSVERELQRRCAPELPLENKSRGKDVTQFPRLISTTDDPSRARALDHQIIEKEDRSLPTVIEDGSARKPAVIARFVSEDALNKVHSVAPGWDRQALLRRFLEWERTHPANDMDKAFLGWAKSYTKGRAA